MTVEEQGVDVLFRKLDIVNATNFRPLIIRNAIPSSLRIGYHAVNTSNTSLGVSTITYFFSDLSPFADIAIVVVSRAAFKSGVGDSMIRIIWHNGKDCGKT